MCIRTSEFSPTDIDLILGLGAKLVILMATPFYHAQIIHSAGTQGAGKGGREPHTSAFI